MVGRSQLSRLYYDLKREADGKQRIRDLRKELRGAAKPMIPLVRASIMSMSSKNENAARGRKPLRVTMARAVTIQTRFTGQRAGVYVFMNPRKMPDGFKSIPAYFEQADLRGGKYKKLRHRVYPTHKNPDTWVEQDVPSRGYFTWAVRNGDKEAERAVKQVLDQTARRLGG